MNKIIIKLTTLKDLPEEEEPVKPPTRIIVLYILSKTHEGITVYPNSLLLDHDAVAVTEDQLLPISIDFQTSLK